MDDRSRAILMLPVLDGFAVLRQLRRQSNVPVIMLTARASEQGFVGGLGEGADVDEVVKGCTLEADARQCPRIGELSGRVLNQLSAGRWITPAILMVGKPISVKVKPLFSGGVSGNYTSVVMIDGAKNAASGREWKPAN